MELSELVGEARSILVVLEDGVDALIRKFANELSDRDFTNLWALWNACRIYDDDVVALCGAGRYWSVIVLLRALVDGTAKFSYLLSSSDRKERERRFSCFCEYAREKDMGSLEQSSSRMLFDGEYGTGTRKQFVKNTIIKQIETEKSQSGSSNRNRTAANELEYRKITGKLEAEFPVWKMFKAQIDNQRARANGYSHLNSLACEDIARTTLRYIKNPWQDIEARMSTHLVDVCVLKRIRCEALLHANGKSDTRFCEVIKRHKCFCDSCVKSADDKVAEMMRGDCLG